MPALDKTEAINLIRSSVGEPPVDAAEVAAPTQPEVIKALRVLDDETRKVQLRGWSFNRELNVELTPNGANKLPLDADVIHVEPATGRGIYAIRRDPATTLMSLYDRFDNTFEFSGVLRVELIRLLDFDDIPIVGREFIKCRAARMFAEAYLGEPQPGLRADEAVAMGLFHDVETEMSDLRMDNARDMYQIVGRLSPLDLDYGQ